MNIPTLFWPWLCLIFFLTSPCFANNPLVGTWKLVSIKHRQIPSGIESDDYGSHPKGYLHYSSDGHVMVMIFKSDRPKPKERIASPAEAQALLSSMTSYAGTYQIKENKIIHHIDIAWNESWSGTQQVRYYQLNDNRLTLKMAPFNDPTDGKITVILVWEKVSSS